MSNISILKNAIKTCSNLTRRKKINRKEITFYNCNIQDDQDFHLNIINKKIKITDSKISSKFININGTLKELRLDNIDFDNNITFRLNGNYKHFWFRNLKNIGNIEIGKDVNYLRDEENSYIPEINFIDIHTKQQNKDIIFINFHSDKIALNKIKSNVLSFKGLNCKICPGIFDKKENNNSLKILNSQVNKIQILDSEFGTSYFDEVIIKYLGIYHSFINIDIQSIIGEKLEIMQNPENNETNFINLQIQNTTFKKDSKLHLKNLNIENFTLSNITQEWTEAIFENIIIPKDGKLKLENVDL